MIQFKSEFSNFYVYMADVPPGVYINKSSNKIYIYNSCKVRFPISSKSNLISLNVAEIDIHTLEMDTDTFQTNMPISNVIIRNIVSEKYDEVYLKGSIFSTVMKLKGVDILHIDKCFPERVTMNAKKLYIDDIAFMEDFNVYIGYVSNLTICMGSEEAQKMVRYISSRYLVESIMFNEDGYYCTHPGIRQNTWNSSFCIYEDNKNDCKNSLITPIQIDEFSADLILISQISFYGNISKDFKLSLPNITDVSITTQIPIYLDGYDIRKVERVILGSNGCIKTKNVNDLDHIRFNVTDEISMQKQKFPKNIFQLSVNPFKIDIGFNDIYLNNKNRILLLYQRFSSSNEKRK